MRPFSMKSTLSVLAVSVALSSAGFIGGAVSFQATTALGATTIPSSSCFYIPPNHKNINWSNCWMRQASIAFANLTGANLSGVNLSSGLIDYANLTNANLSLVNLTGAELTGANLRNANLTGANLSNANLSLVNLTGANLTRANLTGAICPNNQTYGAGGNC